MRPGRSHRPMIDKGGSSGAPARGWGVEDWRDQAGKTGTGWLHRAGYHGACWVACAVSVRIQFISSWLCRAQVCHYLVILQQECPCQGGAGRTCTRWELPRMRRGVCSSPGAPGRALYPSHPLHASAACIGGLLPAACSRRAPGCRPMILRHLGGLGEYDPRVCGAEKAPGSEEAPLFPDGPEASTVFKWEWPGARR